MDIKAKLRPFYVAKMLYEQTDEDHYLTIAQIMEQLEKDYGISTSRGTVGDDIKALQELGVEIEVVPSTQKRFSLIGRRFDLPELKTLIDAVESARFIPKEKSAALVEKLGSLTSQHITKKLVRNVDVENRIKADNEKIYYIMEALNDAINANKKVSFQYPPLKSQRFIALAGSVNLEIMLGISSFCRAQCLLLQMGSIIW